MAKRKRDRETGSGGSSTENGSSSGSGSASESVSDGAPPAKRQKEGGSSDDGSDSLPVAVAMDTTDATSRKANDQNNTGSNEDESHDDAADLSDADELEIDYEALAAEALAQRQVLGGGEAAAPASQYMEVNRTTLDGAVPAFDNAHLEAATRSLWLIKIPASMDVADLGDLRAKLDVVNGEKRAVGLTSSSDGPIAASNNSVSTWHFATDVGSFRLHDSSEYRQFQIGAVDHASPHPTIVRRNVTKMFSLEPAARPMHEVMAIPSPKPEAQLAGLKRRSRPAGFVGSKTLERREGVSSVAAAAAASKAKVKTVAVKEKSKKKSTKAKAKAKAKGKGKGKKKGKKKSKGK